MNIAKLFFNWLTGQQFIKYMDGGGGGGGQPTDSKVYQTNIPRNVRVSEAPSHGKSIFEHDPHGLGAQAYGALADEFLTRHAAVGPLLAGA